MILLDILFDRSVSFYTAIRAGPILTLPVWNGLFVQPVVMMASAFFLKVLRTLKPRHSCSTKSHSPVHWRFCEARLSTNNPELEDELPLSSTHCCHDWQSVALSQPPMLRSAGCPVDSKCINSERITCPNSTKFNTSIPQAKTLTIHMTSVMRWRLHSQTETDTDLPGISRQQYNVIISKRTFDLIYCNTQYSRYAPDTCSDTAAGVKQNTEMWKSRLD